MSQPATDPGRAGGHATAELLPPGGQPALAYLLRSTAKRPLTVAEARDKLCARNHPEDVCDAVLAHALDRGVLDDQAFADAWVQDRGVTRGYGRQRLQRELRRRKIDQHTIDRALARLDDIDEVAQATDLARARAQRMPASVEPPKVAGRLVSFLLRRGFDSGIAHQVARKVTALDRDWD